MALPASLSKLQSDLIYQYQRASCCTIRAASLSLSLIRCEEQDCQGGGQRAAQVEVVGQVHAL